MYVEIISLYLTRKCQKMKKTKKQNKTKAKAKTKKKINKKRKQLKKFLIHYELQYNFGKNVTYHQIKSYSLFEKKFVK